jgi:hypothetical protein
MTIQIIRRDGKIRGVAFFLGKAKVIAASDESRAYWHVCDHCAENEAFVFCKTHSQYICDRCVVWHGRKSYGGAFIEAKPCAMMSISVAKELAHQALHTEEISA